jgi:predicted Zn-dependent peptidase
VVTTNMPHVGSVAVCFFLGTGSRYESDMQAGISHFIEHLCFKGTPIRPTANDIATAIEGVGGLLNASTDKELTVYWTKVATPHFHLALDVLVDMLLNSTFDPAEIERERQVIIEEIHMTKDIPAQQVNLLIDELLWPGHPLGRDIAGSEESMGALTREMVLSYLQEQYLPGNTVVAIAGNIQHDDAVEAVSRVSGEWSKQQVHPEFLPYQEQPNPRLKIERKDTEQAHLSLALPGIHLLHPQRFVLNLLNVILGEGMSSRLFTEIRDRLGLAYSIHSYIDHLLDSGSITIQAGVEPENLPVTIKAILEQLDQLKKDIPEPELVKAKEFAKGNLLMRLENTRSVAGWMGGQEVLTGRILTVEQVLSIIDAVTIDELKQAAQEYFIGEKLRLAVVGPTSDEVRLEELLKL